MAVDNRSKRASSVGILLPFVLAPPLPDGTIAQADRQHIAWSYSGILATAAATIEAVTALTLHTRDLALSLANRDLGLSLEERDITLTVTER